MARHHPLDLKEGKSPKAKINKENLRQSLILFKYIRPYRGQFILGMVFIVLTAFSTSLFPFFLGKMIDAVSPGAKLPGANIGSQIGINLKTVHWGLNTALLLIFCQLAVQTLFSFMRVYSLTSVGEKSLADMRRDVYSKLLTMPMSFFTEKRVGELSNRISSDLSTIQDAISFTFAEFLRGVFMLLIGLFAVFYINTKLALITLSIVPLLGIVAVVFGKRIRKMSRKAQDQLADSGTIVQETFHGISIVKAFTSEYYEITRYVKSLKAVVTTAISNGRWRGAFVAFMIFSLFGTLAFVVWNGAHMVQNGTLTFGFLITFMVFAMFVGGTFAGFADMFSQLQKTLGATQTVREILRSEGEAVELKPIVVEPKYNLQGNVRFDHLAFSYPSRKDITVLQDLSLTASNGEQIAIVGPSGAGKSTIAALLLQFYEPDHGVLYFDERPAKEFPISQLRRQMAYVPQDVILFGGSIRENIAYGKPGATEEEIYSAAKNSNALEFIERFPEKFETIVGERGVKLSGGQRQRIAIARAILKDPAILILDEATSSLDSESEQLVQDALDNLMKNRTSFVIAHRLSTIRSADKIVVIDKGVVVESGSHVELINANGLYRKLNEMQFDFGEITQSASVDK